MLRNRSSNFFNAGEAYSEFGSNNKDTPAEVTKAFKVWGASKSKTNTSRISENEGKASLELGSSTEDILEIPQKTPKLSKSDAQIKLHRNTSGTSEHVGELSFDAGRNNTDLQQQYLVFNRKNAVLFHFSKKIDKHCIINK